MQLKKELRVNQGEKTKAVMYGENENLSSQNLLLKTSNQPDSTEVIQMLIAAVQAGEQDEAKELVSKLTSLKLKLDISVPQEDLELRKTEKEFSVKVHVEDRESKGCFIQLMVKSCDTIRDLKRKMMLKHNFPTEVQRWIIGKKICADKDKLSQCGVKGPRHTLYLYLVTARSVGLTKDQYETQKLSPYSSPAQVVGLPQSTLDNQSSEFPSNFISPFGPSPSRQESKRSLNSGSSLLQEVIQSPAFSINNLLGNTQSTSPVNSQMGQAGSSPGNGSNDWSRDGSGDWSINSSSPKLPDAFVPTSMTSQEGWRCPACTYINLPTRPGCEICTGSRPDSYCVPPNYQMTPEEILLLKNEQALERMARERTAEEADMNFQHLLQTDILDLVQNTEAFTCPICFDDVEEGEGVVLRECLHMFCRNCLQATVAFSNEAVLKCPFNDDTYSCEAVLQEREVKALVPLDVYQKYLKRGLDQAESQAANSYHCKSTDCIGWCLYEDMVNFFTCPVCLNENCLTCKAIHKGMNCKEYQLDLQVRAENDVAAKQTQEMLKKMVAEGEAMHCPTCQVVIQKKSGCDWLKCSICKTEICWVTKGPRWGPKGPGDTTGGCGCQLQTKKCHPDCINCH